jgi:sulfide:quinone oxidoreductase
VSNSIPKIRQADGAHSRELVRLKSFPATMPLGHHRTHRVPKSASAEEISDCRLNESQTRCWFASSPIHFMKTLLTHPIMKTLLILGAGTAGTMMANRLRKRLTAEEWKITIVDEDPTHYYQPGFLFLPFGIFSQKDVIKPKRHFIPGGVNYLEAEIDRMIAERNCVSLKSGEHLKYDVLIIATGAKTAPEQTEGMLGNDWRTRVFDFYTFEGASALRGALRNWNGGRLVVHITAMPIKCAVAPLEFAFLADSWLKDRRLRDKTEIVYFTPLSTAFTKPIAADVLGHVLEEKRIKVVTDFHIGCIDNDKHKSFPETARKLITTCW